MQSVTLVEAYIICSLLTDCGKEVNGWLYSERTLSLVREAHVRELDYRVGTIG